MKRWWTRSSLVLVLALAGCRGETSQATAEVAAVDFDGHDCAACGMIVREQPAPRGQVQHVDGARLYFCSISDLLTYLGAPSPHGKVKGIWVEAIDPASDPLAFDPARRPWVEAERAFFVLGLEKPRVMGTPIVSYTTESEARRVAEAHPGATVSDWSRLKSDHGL